MTDADLKLASAKAEAAEARADLNRTLATLQRRLDPRSIARTTIDTVRDRGEEMADDAVEFARRRPVATGAAAAAAVALVANRPIRKGLAALFRRRKPTSAEATVAAVRKFNEQLAIQGPDPRSSGPFEEK